MYISRISIKNFRGIKNQTLEFTKYNSLIGKNDCGKSTIINAINFFFNDEKASSNKDFNKYISKNKDITIEVEISEYNTLDLKPYLIAEKDTGFDEVVQDYVIDGVLKVKKVWEFSDKAEISCKTYLFVNSFKDYDIYGDPKSLKKWLTDLKLEVPVEGVGGNSDVEKQSVIRNHLLSENHQKKEIKIELKTKDLSNLKKCLPEVKLFRADQSIETTTTDFKKTFSTEVKNVISAQKENKTLEDIETAIKNQIKQESEEIKDFMKQHISDLQELKITPNFDWVKGVEITDVEIKLDGDEGLIPLENKGSGYRRLFMVGRLRYLAKKDESKNVIYLVEEPETFLHPSAQDEMRDSLIDLSESNQIFITTHSPIFTGATKPEGLILCKKENSELKYEKSEDDDFLIKIAKEIGVKPTHNILDSYETIIFVEGSNDRKFIEISTEKLGKKIDSSKVAIIDGGGNSLGNFIDIKYFEKQGKKMFLIIDSDVCDPNQITDEKKQKSLNDKKQANISLKEKFNEKDNAKCFILKKKNIDTYYHPAAIKRLNPNFPLSEIFANNFCYETYVKENKSAIKENIKNKNWIEVFEQMTTEEWQEVSKSELETIFGEIILGLKSL
jgi:predicted ATP-dependent endonuclease of OLD family